MRDIGYTLEFSLNRPRQAQLSSSLLDPVVNPGRRVLVDFEKLESLSTENESACTIESFQINSMLAYLNNQDAIRDRLEDHLARARAAWLQMPLQVDQAVWNDSKLDHLWLPCIEHDIADGGTRQTESMFILVFNVAWDEEHVTRTAKFRNGQFVKLGIEGD